MSQEFAQKSPPPRQTGSESPQITGRANRFTRRVGKPISALLSSESRDGEISPVIAPATSAGQDVAECVHPRDHFEPRFSTSDYISGDSFLVGYCNRCHLHVTAPVPANV